VKEKVVHERLSHHTAVEIRAIPDQENQRKVADIAIKQTQDLVSTIKKL
jgi:hypothetical protein